MILEREVDGEVERRSQTRSFWEDVVRIRLDVEG